VALALNSGSVSAVTAILSDTYNNTWKQACRAQTTGNLSFSTEIWYAENCNGGVNHQITITPSISAFVAFSVAQYSGVATTGALGQVRTNFAPSGNPSGALNSGSITTPAAGALYTGAAQWGGVNLAATTEPGWTGVFANLPSATTAAISVEALGDVSDSPAGTFAATWTLGSPQPWAACLAAFLPAPPNPFQGRIDEVAVYDRVLSVESILTHGLAAFNK
jgi:hypothetical protein